MSAKLPPVNRTPENTAGMAFLPIEDYHVGSWGPLPDGKGPSTQVHFTIRVEGLPFVIRLKSADACDTLIAALQRHRYDVWPRK
ncbi:MAG TPA: hypothetical protein VG815_18120 [Chloroflexota bacterium]|jgi:hypothetical protein|nr:hypothetical protein [Chloroflexota bacterium]